MITASSPWTVSFQDFPSTYPIQVQLKYLLQYANLAPSTRNSQPWRFSVGENTVGIFADLSRWQPVSDRGRRELYISLGCALENLLVAAEQFGFRHTVHYFPQPSNEELAATVVFQPGGEVSDNRTGIALHSITARHTHRGLYQDEPIVEEVRRRLLNCCNDPDLRMDLTDDPAIRSRVLELNLHADEMEFADPEFRKELGYWVAKGLFGGPRLLSRLAGTLFARINLGGAIGKRNAAVLSSAPLIGLISTRLDDRTSQVRTGQMLERLWLRATSIGLALQPMSQALEIPSLRGELALVIGDGSWMPQQLFRIGYPMACEKGHTTRRSLDQVLLG